MEKEQHQAKVVTRRADVPPEPSDARIRQRADFVARFGIETWNQPFYSTICAKCKKRTLMDTLIVLADPKYSWEDFDGMIACAVNCCFMSSIQGQGMTSQCCPGAPGRLACDYFVFHSGLRKDLVVRTMQAAEPNCIEYALHFADGAGYRAAPVLTDDQKAVLKRDNLLRFAAQWLELMKDPADGLSFIKRAFQLFPGDPAQLRFVNRLLAIRQIGLAEGIAREHLERFPRDPEAHYLLSEVLLQGYVAHPQEKGLLVEAEHHARAALSLKSDWPEVHLAICNIMRLRQDPGTAREFEKLLRNCPKYAQAHYNYALHYLMTKPELALKHFKTGEQLSPNDPDYPLGCVRSLIRMGKIKEAWIALGRAKKLSPTHPRIRELEQQLGARHS